MPEKVNPSPSNHTSSWGIFIGLVVGSIIGYFFHLWGENDIRNWLLTNLIEPAGDVFLRSLWMVIVPLVAGSLLVGIVNLGTGALLRRLGWKVVLFYLTTTLCATFVGQTLINTVRPGETVPQEMAQQALEESKEKVDSLREQSEWVGKSLWPGIIDKIIPKNILRQYSAGNMLTIIFVSILFGMALLGMKTGGSKDAFIGFFSILSEVSIKIVGWIMKIAPYSIAALMISAVASFGPEIMKNVFFYVLTVLAALLIHFLVIYGIIMKFFIKISPIKFYKKAAPIFLTAFGTSSSAATMPVTIRTLEKEFGVPDSITTFTVPIGVTINMDGTALFEVMAALFIAQVFGVDLSLMEHITLVLLVMITSIGIAGVPGGSIPILMAAMASVGIPAEGIALVLGVDRLLDMSRTIVNVTGDSVAALFLTRSENIPLDLDSPPSHQKNSV